MQPAGRNALGRRAGLGWLRFLDELQEGGGALPVYLGLAKRIGWSALHLARTSEPIPSRFVARLRAAIRHGDTFDLPDGCAFSPSRRYDRTRHSHAARTCLGCGFTGSSWRHIERCF